MAFPYQSKPLSFGGELGFRSGGGDFQKQGSDKASAPGTEVSGYVESPIEKRCGTCEYLKNGNLCAQETVLRDPEVKDDGNGLKVVDPQNGCCNFWEAKITGQVDSSEDLQPTRPTSSQRTTKPEDLSERPARVRLTFY